MNKIPESRLYTIVAFLLGMFLSDELDSTEQNALGNWLMLVAQTLCTNGSYDFDTDWKQRVKKEGMGVNKMLFKIRDSVDKVNDFLNSNK